MAQKETMRRQMLALRVRQRRQLSAHFVRVTIGGDALAGFTYEGADQCFRLFFSRPGQRELQLPGLVDGSWAKQYFLMPDEVRPVVRNYTVRAYRPASHELDIDFIVHGTSPASTWALTAQIGSPVGMFDEGRRYWLREDATWQWLVADESALPAALAIAEETPTTMPTRLIAEIPSIEDALDVEAGPHVAVEWLPRTGQGTAPGELALRSALADAPPSGPGSVFVAGESAMSTGVRRGLIAAGVPKSAISFFGYWKRDSDTPT